MPVRPALWRVDGLVSHTNRGTDPTRGGEGDDGLFRTERRTNRRRRVGPVPPDKLLRRHSAMRDLSLAEIVEMKKRDFGEKRRFLRRKFDALRSNDGKGNIHIEVEIGSLLEGSLDRVMGLSKEKMRMNWEFSLVGGTVSDGNRFAGEWLELIMKKLCDPNNGLWGNRGKQGDGTCLYINPWSGTLHPDHLSYFHFMGRLMGKALLEDHPVPYHMMPHMYKCLVGADFSLNDINVLDPRYHRVMEQLDQVQDFNSLGLNFMITEEAPFGGAARGVELVPGGADVIVTDDNLNEYKEALTNYLLIGRVKCQLRAFLSGIDDVVPLAYLSVFGTKEIEVLMCGSLGIFNLDTGLH